MFVNNDHSLWQILGSVDRQPDCPGKLEVFLLY